MKSFRHDENIALEGPCLRLCMDALVLILFEKTGHFYYILTKNLNFIKQKLDICVPPLGP